MQAFLDFDEVGLPDYIFFPSWEIFGKCFPKNLRTVGDTLSQGLELPEHSNCLPPKRAYSKIFFPKKANDSEKKNAKAGGKDSSQVVVDKKINEIIETLHKNLLTSSEIKENVERINTNVTEDIEEIKKGTINILDSGINAQNKINKAIHESASVESSNLKFGASGGFKEAIEFQKAKSRQLTTETIIELEKRLAANGTDTKTVTMTDFKDIKSTIQETKEKTMSLDRKIEEQKRTIEDFLNS